MSKHARRHAAGPWVTFDCEETDHIYINTSGGIPIADLVKPELGGDRTTEANARLIAAAPDLLAALQEIANNPSPNGRGFGHWAQLVIAAPAIAKANGGDAK